MTTFKYPPEAANGKLVLSDRASSEAIISAIQTRHGERVLRNTYGNNLDEFVSINDLSSILAELHESIINSTRDYRQMSLAVGGFIDDDGHTRITVEYDDDQRNNTLTVTL